MLCLLPDKRADDAEDNARPALEHESEKSRRKSGIAVRQRRTINKARGVAESLVARTKGPKLD